jgi:hypothetical protein
VLCDVYPIRHRGQRRDPEKIRLRAYRGELIYNLRLYHAKPQWSIMKATLVSVHDGVTYLLPVLDRARLLRIRGDDLLITGTEIIPTTFGIKNIKSDDFPQTWWCVRVLKP